MNSLWIWQSCGCVYPADTSLQNELCPLLSVVMADNDSVPRRSYQRVLEHKAVCELAYCLRLLPTAPSHPHPLPPPCSVPQCVWLVAQTPSIRIALQCSNEEGGRGGEEHISAISADRCSFLRAHKETTPQHLLTPNSAVCHLLFYKKGGSSLHLSLIFSTFHTVTVFPVNTSVFWLLY